MRAEFAKIYRRPRSGPPGNFQECPSFGSFSWARKKRTGARGGAPGNDMAGKDKNMASWKQGRKPFGAVKMGTKVFFVIFLAALACLSCVGLGKAVIDVQLVSEMEGDCKKVEIKRDFEQTAYVIAYTGKISKDRCPLALIQGWKDGKIIREKEVEICGCRSEKDR